MKIYLKMHFHEGVYYKNAGTFLHEVSKHHDKPYSVVYEKITSQFFLPFCLFWMFFIASDALFLNICIEMN